MSVYKGFEFHHELNSSTNPSISNNITVNTSNDINTDKATSPVISVAIDSSEQPQQAIPPIESSAISNENEFLKKLLLIYMNQKFYWQNKALVLTPDELLELIQTLLPNKSVVITTTDIDEVNCCGFIKDVPIKKIDSIWVEDENVKQSFKYQYSNLVALFDQYKISIKYVRAQ